MISIYCKANHNRNNELCIDCNVLNNYAMKRLENCPFGNNKPTCSICTVHCYKKDMQLQIKEVMRFAGPRMLFKHPIATIHHFIREYKRKKLNLSIVKKDTKDDTNNK